MFIFETPYTTGPKLQTDDLSKQQKKKTLFTTELAFPYLKNRLEIVAKREVIISPIENAIELIEDRVAKLRTELETNPPRLNSLHQVIQGSVVPSAYPPRVFSVCSAMFFLFLFRMYLYRYKSHTTRAVVNAGPLHVCEVFLSRTQGEWPEGHVKTLRKAIEDLTRLCGFSIALSKSIIKYAHLFGCRARCSPVRQAGAHSVPADGGEALRRHEEEGPRVSRDQGARPRARDDADG